MQAAASWAQSDASSKQHEEPESFDEATYQPDAGDAEGGTNAYLQQTWSQDLQGPASALPEPTKPSSTEQKATPRASVEEYPEASVNSAAALGDNMPGQVDRTAANLSKELRKLQAESAVLQEHSRRLQEKAAVIQQQRTSSDQVHRTSHNILSALLAAHVMSTHTVGTVGC